MKMALTRDDVYAIAHAIATVDGHGDANGWAEQVAATCSNETAIAPAAEPETETPAAAE
jgi:hypothetical protein